MTQKERLVELLISNELRDTPEEAANELQERADFLKPWAEKCADYLLSKGVIVPPCKGENESPPKNATKAELWRWFWRQVSKE